MNDSDIYALIQQGIDTGSPSWSNHDILY